jgi:hypothetical protein
VPHEAIRRYDAAVRALDTARSELDQSWTYAPLEVASRMTDYQAALEDAEEAYRAIPLNARGAVPPPPKS